MSIVFKIQQAKKEAIVLAKQRLIIFLLSDPLVPRKTGLMANTALSHMFDGSYDDNSTIGLWFDTFYADFVEDKVHFIENITDPFIELCQQAQIEAFARQGLKITF